MTLARRIAIQSLLWAAPVGVCLALLLLVSQARWFGSGPGVPSAGDERAWNAMWGAFGLAGLGCVVGGVAALSWIVVSWRRRHRPSAVEWFRTGVNLLFALGACWLWLR